MHLRPNRSNGCPSRVNILLERVNGTLRVPMPTTSTMRRLIRMDARVCSHRNDTKAYWANYVHLYGAAVPPPRVNRMKLLCRQAKMFARLG
uniref:Uncharacterized protein n=1 Tax=Hyaloperonospora arabidopsidis (strain Emoy2) TaxID=559515 RepID=M4C2H9_HYAAE